MDAGKSLVYSILSPEGFASILWKDASRAKEAANVMRLTAQDLQKQGIIATGISGRRALHAGAYGTGDGASWCCYGTVFTAAEQADGRRAVEMPLCALSEILNCYLILRRRKGYSKHGRQNTYASNSPEHRAQKGSGRT